ncbi:unnamed protein product [Lactuca virosa]|uniref:Cysteine-rich receptor-like protein kinase 2 n=1 Tax=Lactuca virosa TaxID=75947 RepID=A0AAU9N3S4_9ASTR|nr:unnamed protein product [Lactuca virosa]
MKKSTLLIALITIPLLISTSNGDARTQVIKMYCDEGFENNQTIFVPNFVQAMEIINVRLRTSNNATIEIGTGPNKNYALAQCFNDLSSQDCMLCYAQLRTVLPGCYPHSGGRIYIDGCYMRLQNYSFFQEYKGSNDTIVCGNVTRESLGFRDLTHQAVVDVVSEALSSDEYFGRAEVVVARGGGGGNESVFVMAECWRTLSPADCRKCLENASAAISKCLPSSEGRALNTGCFMRYSDRDFLNPVEVIQSSNNRGKMVAVIVSIVSSVVVLVVALTIVLYIRRRRYIQYRRRGSYDAEKLAKILTDSSLNFKYSTIEKATANWDESNKLGQGGFGTVYKGVLSDGREIAVKRLYVNNKFRVADFYNEVNIISSVEHKNLVRLLGCSCSGPESILVYEYLPNMSLDRFIFDEIKGRTLNWEKRFEIIIGTTEADFGLARSFQDDQTHLSTAIAGTLGYMAPEYLAHGQLTEKADVYSFGVLLLEIVTGIENNRSNTAEYTDSIVSAAWKHFQEGTVEQIFDPNLLMDIYPNIIFKKDAIKVVHVGLLCTQEAPSLRPTMSTVLKMLAKDEHLPFPSNPPFIDEKTMELNNITQTILGDHEGESSYSIATISHSQFYPR